MLQKAEIALKQGIVYEQDKVMRGFKGKENAQFLADAHQTYYNFVRPHQGLVGLTPSQMAGIRASKERNRWKELLTFSLKE